MIQVVCDRCHRELDPSRMDSSDYAFTVYVAGESEPVIAYEDLCGDCLEELIEGLKTSKPKAQQKPKKETPKKKPAPKKPDVKMVDVGPKESVDEPLVTMSQEKLELMEPDGHVVARKPIRHGGR